MYVSSIVFVGFILVVSGVEGHDRKVRLRDVGALTLHQGKMTNARRGYAIPQLKCVGGTAGCSKFIPQVVQCYNRGWDGYDVQWECKTDMDNAYRFGRIQVSCEGYAYPEDEYILAGSCGLEYSIDYTEEGHQKSGQSNYFSGQKTYSYSKKKSGFGDIVFLVIVCLVIYAIYKSCVAPRADVRYDQSTTNDDHGYPGGPTAPPYPDTPPPPYPGTQNQGYGFRPEYTAGADCRQNRANANQGGGFWSGAALGGLAGYFFGGGGQRGYGGYNRGYGGYNRGYGGDGGSWFSGGGGGFGGGSSSSSSGSRSASGFSGTARR